MENTNKIKKGRVVQINNDFETLISSIEQEIASEEAAIEEKKKQRVVLLEQYNTIIEEKRLKIDTELSQLRADVAEIEARAEFYKTKEDIDLAFDKRAELLSKIRLLENEQNMKLVAPDEPKETFWEKLLSSAGTLVVAVVLFGYLAYLSFNHVITIGDEINEANKIAQDTGNVSQMLPPSITKLSFQKAWFSWLNVFTTLLGAILIMAVIAPAQLIFILPFTKTPVKKWKHFFEQSEAEKQWQSYAYFAAVLLFLSLIHIASGAK